MAIYLWETEDYPDKLIGTYDHDRSPNYSRYTDGKILTSEIVSQIPVIEFEVNCERLQRIDCLVHTGGGVPLVNQRVIDLLMDIDEGDFQLIKPQLNCTDGQLDGYYLLNVTHAVHGVDHSQSICEWGTVEHYIRGFKHLVVLPDCLGQHHLAREAESHSHLYVSQIVVDAFTRAKIKGCWFPTPEEFYGSVRDYVNYLADLRKNRRPKAD